MRTISFLEGQMLDSQLYSIRYRLKIKDGFGVYQEYTNRVFSCTFKETIDSMGADLTVELSYKPNPGESGGSLAPLSVGGGDLPVITHGRAITLEVGYAPDAAGVVSTWHKIFEGSIDSVDPTDPSTMTIEARDRSAEDGDRWVEEDTIYGGGTMEAAMQAILDDWGANPGSALYVPTSPGANISEYAQTKLPVLKALRDLAQQIGWDVRWIWHEGTSAFRLTLVNPDRTVSSPMRTFDTGDYFDIRRARLTRSDICNVIRGECGPNGARVEVIISDSASITKYGRRWGEIIEADDSPVNNLTELTTMITAAVADLKESNVEIEMGLHLFPWVQINDFYRIGSNQQWTSAQDFAVTSIEHRISPGKLRTTLGGRGKPASGFYNWLGRMS